MLFTASITAPAETPRLNAVKKDVKLRAGTLKLVRVFVPPGSAYRSHLGILDGETQIIPWGDDQWIEGDGEVFEYDPERELPTDPTTLTLSAWNEGLYPHAFYVKFWVQRKTMKILDVELVNAVLRRLDRFLKRILGER